MKISPQSFRNSAIFKPQHRQNLLAFTVIGLIAFAGVIFLITSRAATGSVSLEAENGTLSGGATAQSDVSASGGRYVRFGSATTSDLIKPVVSITAPAGGATVSGTVNISANATDNVGVTRVEFLVNGTLRGTDSTPPTPFVYAWPAGTTAGTYSLTARAYDAAGNVTTSAAVSVKVGTTTPPPPPPSVTIAAAGDISGQTANDAATAKLINGRLANLAWVLPLGDLQYPEGGPGAGYNSTWGTFKSKTKPTPGNHDYRADAGAGFYRYFSGLPKYYSYNVGSWHLISLNSQESMASTSAQATWLKNDLAANAGAKCTMAYMHYPRYSSPGAGNHGSITSVAPLWQLLINANADVVLAGHDHKFEQFQPMNANGGIDTAKGLASFVVGTGGGGLDPVGTSTGSLGGASAWGVMFMDLQASGYNWQFVDIGGRTLKSGTGTCH